MKSMNDDFESKVNELIKFEPDENDIDSSQVENLSDDSINISLDPVIISDENTDEDSDKIELTEDEQPINEVDLFKEKYYLEKKKRKSVLADRQKLEQENYQLKNALDGTINSSAELYGRDLYNDLEKIKNIKKQALLGAFGDPDDPDYYAKNADILAEAEDLYQKASYKINEFENIISNKNSNVRNNEEVVAEQNYEEQIKLEKAQEWMDEHPELIEGSYSYNPKLSEEFTTFVKQVDRELRKEGREDEILSDRYLELLEEFTETVKVDRPREGYSTSNVGGVKNNFSKSSNSVRVTMTEFDKNMARSLKMKPEDYLKVKIQDMQETGQLKRN
jgi:hypothetical protein